MHQSLNVRLSIIMPIYNEEAILKSSILKNLDILSKSDTTFEIIIINDGSTDNSRAILDDSFKNINQINIKHLSKNKGFGGAIKEGIKIASGDYFWCIPADSPLTEEVFTAFNKNIGKADILVSYRRERIGYSWRMLLNSYIYHWLISNLFSIKLKDYNWIHLYHRKIFDKDNIQIEYDGIFMLAEILIKAQKKKYSFIEFEVIQSQRLTGIATASSAKNIIKTFLDLVNFRLRLYKF
jgi:glycosyltransferase involved in cell wall biosynthesis